MKITSKVIKTALLSYFSIRRHSFTCTEFSHSFGIADIIAFDDKIKYITEVEVKVSKQDLLNEINKKAEKHDRMKTYKVNNYTTYNPHPNKFYFCVTEELIDEALKVISKLNDRYGLMVFTYKRQAPSKSIKIIKRAYKLHNK